MVLSIPSFVNIGYADRCSTAGVRRLRSVRSNLRAVKYIQDIENGIERVQSRHPEFTIDESGSASTGKAVDDALKGKLAKAGLISIPLTLLILLFASGSLVAATVPLLLAITAVIATSSLISLASRSCRWTSPCL